MDKNEQILSSLLAAACCPQCDGSGSFADSEGNQAQCQWCYERQQLFSDKESAIFIKALHNADVLAHTSETISLNLPLSINIDDVRAQTLAVIRAHERQILINEDIEYLEKVVNLLDDILEKAINAKKQRVNK